MMCLGGQAQVNATAIGYDARGNLTSDGTASFAYSTDNLLVSASGGVSLSYDPLLRLSSVRRGTAANQIRRLDYDGASLIAERDGAGTLARRFVHGPGTDEPLVQYEGATTSNRRFHADERGSIVALSCERFAPRQLRRSSRRRAKWASTARRMPSAIWLRPSGEFR